MKWTALIFFGSVTIAQYQALYRGVFLLRAMHDRGYAVPTCDRVECASLPNRTLPAMPVFTDVGTKKLRKSPLRYIAVWAAMLAIFTAFPELQNVYNGAPAAFTLIVVTAILCFLWFTSAINAEAANASITLCPGKLTIRDQGGTLLWSAEQPANLMLRAYGSHHKLLDGDSERALPFAISNEFDAQLACKELSRALVFEEYAPEKEERPTHRRGR